MIILCEFETIVMEPILLFEKVLNIQSHLLSLVLQCSMLKLSETLTFTVHYRYSRI